MTSPKHLKLSVVALVALAVGSGCRDPVDPAGDLDPGHAGDRRPAAAMTGQLDVLDSLYWQTGGENWNNNTNWLTDEPLDDWYGVTADDQGNVTRLNLAANALTGSIPAELGDLESLEYLRLHGNDLTGSIPAELGDLDSLEYLHLAGNDLAGSIPAELGDLESLRHLYLYNNALTDSIPAELGDLDSLTRLHLHGNNLTGSIPAELGDLENLTVLSLFNNALTGSIPAELGEMDSLTELYLYNNALTGSIPAELGEMESLRYLRLHGNSGLTGPLPNELTGTPLNRFHWYDTGLCAPTNAAFQQWLNSISDEQGALNCDRWVLHLLYRDTGGENWASNTNWLTDEP
ncbi:MAG: leucine-rich repeat domain-containing protein, partial [Gemmatimonadetes bacterium]|nr:leucine-rich repeat domain-containing protein [Gemmatimonadota bacterium]